MQRLQESPLEGSVHARLQVRRRHVCLDIPRVLVTAHRTLTARRDDGLGEPVFFAGCGRRRRRWRRWWHLLHRLVRHRLFVRALGAADAEFARVSGLLRTMRRHWWQDSLIWRLEGVRLKRWQLVHATIARAGAHFISNTSHTRAECITCARTTAAMVTLHRWRHSLCPTHGRRERLRKRSRCLGQIRSITAVWLIAVDSHVNHAGVVLLRLLKHCRRRWRGWRPSEMLQLRKHDGGSLRFLFWHNDDIVVRIPVKSLVDAGNFWLIGVRERRWRNLAYVATAARQSLCRGGKVSMVRGMDWTAHELLWRS